MSSSTTLVDHPSHTTRTASCRCGKLAYSIKDSNRIFCTLCHCRNCRKGTSAPVSLVIGVPEDSFEWIRVLKTCPASEKLDLFYCGECGGYVAHKAGGIPFVGTLACCYDEVKDAFCGKQVIDGDPFFKPQCPEYIL